MKQVEEGLPSTIIGQAHSLKHKALLLHLADYTFSIFSEGLQPLANGVALLGLRHCEDFLYLDDYGCFLVLHQE